MKVSEALEQKQNRKLVTIRPEDTIETTATLLATNKIGAMPVRDEDGKLVGVISERDIVRGMSDKGGRAVSLSVQTLMTSPVTTCSPDDNIASVLDTMTQRHFRHMPVLDGNGNLMGMISQGDLVKCQLEQAKMEVNVLRDVAIATR